MALFLKILITYNCHYSLIFLHVKIQISKIQIPIKFFLFFEYYRYKKVYLQNFTIFPTILRQQRRHWRWIIFACKNCIFCQKNTSFTQLSSFIWGSREIIFLKLTQKFKIQHTKFWLQGVASSTDLAWGLLSKQLFLLVSSEKLLGAKRHSPYIIFSHNLPNLYRF